MMINRGFSRNRLGSSAPQQPTPEQKLERLNTAIRAIISDDISTVLSCIPGNIDVGASFDLVLGIDLGKPRRVKATLLHLALHHRATRCAKLLLHLGAPTEASESDLGDRALHSAVRTGSYDLVTLLLEYGCAITSNNSSGETPLHLAAEKGLVHITMALLDSGAEPLAKNRYHETCWEAAMLSGTPSSIACAELIRTQYILEKSKGRRPTNDEVFV